MLKIISFFLAGIWFALDAVDIYLTRDGIRAGKTIEKVRAMRWWMANDFRAISLLILELPALLISTYFFPLITLPFWLYEIIFVKIKVCIKNYKLNISVLK
jgi:hypothetical protein